MEPSKYFRDRVETFLTYLPERTLNAGIDVVTTLIVYDMAYPCTPQDYQHALALWLQVRHDVWQDRINVYKSNPTNENLAIIAGCAIREHTPHTQSDFDGLVEYAYRFAINETLIENELKRRSNDNDER
jgi:hypothetical protein